MLDVFVVYEPHSPVCRQVQEHGRPAHDAAISEPEGGSAGGCRIRYPYPITQEIAYLSSFVCPGYTVKGIVCIGSRNLVVVFYRHLLGIISRCVPNTCLCALPLSLYVSIKLLCFLRRLARAVSAGRLDIPAVHLLQAIHQRGRVRSQRIRSSGTLNALQCISCVISDLLLR